jgi:hypothetical protein
MKGLAVGSDFSTHRCRILFWTSPNRRCVLIICRRSSRVIVLSRGTAVFAQDQREAAERLARETAEREAAERANAAFERAQRETAERLAAARRTPERSGNE